MTILDLTLDPGTNRPFYDILDAFNDLAPRITALNSKMDDAGPTGFSFRGRKAVIADLATETQVLQEAYTEWRRVAHTFVSNPVLQFDPNVAPAGLMFARYTDAVRDLQTEARVGMQTVEGNLKWLDSDRARQVNFVIAIGSAALSLLGLILSMIGMAIALSSG